MNCVLADTYDEVATLYNLFSSENTTGVFKNTSGEVFLALGSTKILVDQRTLYDFSQLEGIASPVVNLEAIPIIITVANPGAVFSVISTDINLELPCIYF